MTKFIVIEPQAERLQQIECNEFEDAIRAAGLCRGKVDHGVVAPHLGIVVFEFGLFMHPDQMHFAVINGALHAGNVVIYGFDEEGRTCDVDAFGEPELKYTFLHGRYDVEAAILAGMCARPQIAVDQQVIWRWPDPVPFDFPKQ